LAYLALESQELPAVSQKRKRDTGGIIEISIGMLSTESALCMALRGGKGQAFE